MLYSDIYIYYSKCIYIYIYIYIEYKHTTDNNNRNIEKSVINNALIRTTTAITKFNSGFKVIL